MHDEPTRDEIVAALHHLHDRLEVAARAIEANDRRGAVDSLEAANDELRAIVPAKARKARSSRARPAAAFDALPTDPLAHLREFVADLRAETGAVADELQCVECGCLDDGRERGWTLRLDVDHDLVAFCPDCDEREFRGGLGRG